MDKKTLLLTCLADTFFCWILFYFGMGGLASAVYLMTHFGVLAWLVLGIVLFLVLYHSDYRIDAPLFLAGLLLGFWGEWWGTTRGVWAYWNGAQPPAYLPPLWGIGLLTVYRLSRWVKQGIMRLHAAGWRAALGFSLAAIPILAFVPSLPVLSQVNWRGRLDVHFYAGILAALILLLPRFDLDETISIFLCGMCLGGIYEWGGTSFHEWAYITGEVPPLWIAPLWGLACAAMVRLGQVIACKFGFKR